MDRETINNRLRTLASQYRILRQPEIAQQIEEYINSNWASAIGDPTAARTVQDILSAGGYQYGTPASQQGGANQPTQAAPGDNTGATSPTTLPATGAQLDDPGRREQGPGFSPVGPPGTTPQITPGGANTLGTANLVATPPGLPTAGGPANPGGAGSVAYGQNAIFGQPGQQGDEQFLQAILDKIGIDLGNPGLFGNIIARSINDYIPYYRSLLGLQGGMGVGDVNSMYTTGVQSIADLIGSNTLQSGMQDFARNVQANATGKLDRLKDVGQQQGFLNALLALSTAGMNPLLQQAATDDATRAWLGFNRANRAAPPGTPGAPKSYFDWLEQQNDPQYGSVINLLGGR